MSYPAAQQAELDAQAAIAERQRDTDVRKAQIQAETAREQAKSAMAGQLEQEAINQQLEEKKGAVEVMKAEQANRAALKQQEVEVTRARPPRELRSSKHRLRPRERSPRCKRRRCRDKSHGGSPGRDRR